MMVSCWLGFHPPCCSGRPLPRGAFRSGGARACTARERVARRTLAATDGDAAAISLLLLSIPWSPCSVCTVLAQPIFEPAPRRVAITKKLGRGVGERAGRGPAQKPG